MKPFANLFNVEALDAFGYWVVVVHAVGQKSAELELAGMSRPGRVVPALGYVTL